jgi:hypothetical protein
MRGKIIGKETGKCPACVRAAKSCVPTNIRGRLLPLKDIRVAHNLHLVPQRDHRYGFFRLFDPRAQRLLMTKPLPYDTQLSRDVPLVNYNPRANHWRPAPLRSGEDPKYLEYDFSRRMLPPKGVSAKDVKAWGLTPEGAVENRSPSRSSSPEGERPPVAGPSRPKPPPRTKPPSRATSKRKMPSPPRPQPPRKRRAVTVITVPSIPSPAPSFPAAPRESLPEDLFSPLRLLETLTAPDMPLPLQQQLVNNHFEQLVMSSGIIQSSINSWNSQVRALRAMGQRLGFVSPVEEIRVVSRQEAVEWEETPVDPRDRKGKKPALRPRAKKGKKTPSEVPESGDDGPEDPHHGKGNGEGEGKDGGSGAMVI